jgi:hypothetical protein
MPKEPNGKTQRTTPKCGDPATIPVPTRKQVLGDLEKVARPAKRRTRDTPDKE